MHYEIVLAPEAAEDLKRLKAHLRTEVKDAIEQRLRHEPQETSRSRIKRLRGLSKPQYRLRVGEVRVFYDISASSVEVRKSYIKMMTGFTPFGVDDVEVLYRQVFRLVRFQMIDDKVLAIVAKSHVEEWLRRIGEPK